MKPFMLLVDERLYSVMDQLFTFAGKSPNTDGEVMNLAAEMRRWLRTSMQEGQNAQILHRDAIPGASTQGGEGPIARAVGQAINP